MRPRTTKKIHKSITAKSIRMRPWVFWDALGTPGGSRTMKKEHPCLNEIWPFFAKMGSILGPLFFEIGPLGSKMAAR